MKNFILITLIICVFSMQFSVYADTENLVDETLETADDSLTELLTEEQSYIVSEAPLQEASQDEIDYQNVNTAATETSTDVHIIDFDTLSVGAVGVPVFDGDFGQTAKREVKKDGVNNLLYIERNLTNNDTGAWVQKTFSNAIDASVGFVFEFSAKQTVSKAKTLNIYSADGSICLFEFGISNTGKVNGKEVSLPNNTDGNLHHYKITVSSQGKIKLSYDGSDISGTFDVKSTSAPNKYRITVGKSTDVSNYMYIDDIMFYSLINPIPRKPEFEIQKDGKTVITSEDNYDIYYTVDGTYPTKNSGILYTEPVAVDDDCYLRAICVNDDAISVCANIGPYPIEYVEKPITPVYSEKMYLLDFEKLTQGAIGTGLGVFDNDWGMCESKEIISENGNLAAHLVKKLSSSATATWLQHTFSDDLVIDTDLGFEFSLKQTLDRGKWVSLYDTSGSTFLKFEFGNLNVAKINGIQVKLENNLDGNYHHYKFEIKENGKIDFWYDGNKVDSSFFATGSVELARSFFSRWTGNRGRGKLFYN